MQNQAKKRLALLFILLMIIFVHASDFVYAGNSSAALQADGMPVFPSEYNSNIKKPLYQSPVKNQHDTDLCWSFAATAAIEASTIKHGGGVSDLSETHAGYALSRSNGNELGFDRLAGGKGTVEAFTAYLMRSGLNGAVNENDDPLKNTANLPLRPLEDTKSRPVSCTIANAYMITGQDFDHARDSGRIKEFIMNYGAVTSIMMISNEFYRGGSPSDAYFYDGSAKNRGGHMVVIIGWDDHYSRENFTENCRPENDGAWLVKNSWGTNWSCGGYAWVSYWDAYIGRSCYAFSPAEAPAPDKRIYDYDPLGYCDYISQDYAMNVFAPAGPDEILTEIKIFVPKRGDHVRVYCLPDFDGGGVPDMHGIKPVIEFDAVDPYGTPCGGYFTIPLDTPAAAGSRFAIAVSYKSRCIPVEAPAAGYSAQASSCAGESYAFNEGDAALTDISARKQNICVKAVTIKSQKAEPVQMPDELRQAADSIMTGPCIEVTRGMAVAALYEAAQTPDADKLPNPFSDVADGRYYTDAVKWAFNAGIISGCGDGRFCPDDIITRQDLILILDRYADYTGIVLPEMRDYQGFRDEAEIARYAKEAVQSFFMAGIISGSQDGLFEPESYTSCAEFEAMLQALFRLADTKGML